MRDAIVLPVDRDRFDLRVEQLEHRAKVRLERPRADRTDAAFAELDDLIALALHVAQLVEQRLPLRLRFLLVAHPLGLRRLELRLRPVRAPRAPATSSSAASTSSAGAASIFARRSRKRDQLFVERAQSSPSACDAALLRCDARSSSRSSASSAASGASSAVRRLELFARRRDLGKLALDARRDRAADASRSLSATRSLGDERLQRIALALEPFPLRRNVVERRCAPMRRAAPPTTRRPLPRALARFRFASTSARCTTSRTPACRRAGPSLPRSIALRRSRTELLRRAQSLVAEHAREKLRALRRAHRRHDARALSAR